MDKKLLEDRLGESFPSERLLCNEPMSEHTTFCVGGPVDFFVDVSSITDIEQALACARDANAPWYIVGCGSDLLIADSGLEGIVIHLGENFADIAIDGSQLTAQAGSTNAEVARAAHEAGLSGYEFASGIPGSIGGAAIMNAGAYDGEFAHVAVSVTCLTPEGDIVEITGPEAEWGYRSSMMSKKGYIVLDATLQLVPWDQDQIFDRMEDLRVRREEKQPLEYGSAGSTFKRPPGYFAGKLIEDAGLRGYTCGGAQVSSKHCGFVINKGNATAKDVLTVIEDVQRAVFNDAGVQLEPEVRIWGFD